MSFRVVSLVLLRASALTMSPFNDSERLRSVRAFFSPTECAMTGTVPAVVAAAPRPSSSGVRGTNIIEPAVTRSEREPPSSPRVWLLARWDALLMHSSIS